MLRQSHIVPKFVGRWLKQTSATGYVRKITEPNVRRQDLLTEELLCQQCEGRLGKLELEFKRSIFDPYVQTELDHQAIATGLIDSFNHDERLLEVAISLQWRTLVKEDLASDKLKAWQRKLLTTFFGDAESYLRGVEMSTGRSETHILFFQNLLAASGGAISRIHDEANFYLMRCTDSTIVYGDHMLGVWTKLGPIGFYTSLRPLPMLGMIGTRIRKTGQVRTAQRILNTSLTSFLLVNRPRELSEHFRLSNTQAEVVDAAMLANPDRTLSSLTFAISLGRDHIRAAKDAEE